MRTCLIDRCTSIPINKARCVSPIFSSVHHRKNFCSIQCCTKFLCVHLLEKKNSFVPKFVRGPHMLRPRKESPFLSCPFMWKNIIYRTGRQIVQITHMAPKLGQPVFVFSLFCFCFYFPFFLLFFFFIFFFPSLFFFFYFFINSNFHFFQNSFFV